MIKKMLLEIVEQNGRTLEHIEEQDREICLTAVKQNGLALEYVKEQDREVCLTAVKQNGRALEYIKDEEILNEILKELNLLYLPETNSHRELIIRGNLCWIGCQRGISVETLVDRIYNEDGGLEENPHRQFYLDFLKENDLI